MPRYLNKPANLYQLPPLIGLLNYYAIYRDNHGALTNADAARPAGAILIVPPGHDIELKQKVKIWQDEHAAELIIDGGVRAFAKCDT